MKDLIDLIIAPLIPIGFILLVVIFPICIGEIVKEYNQLLAGFLVFVLIPVGYVTLWKIALFLDKLTNNPK